MYAKVLSALARSMAPPKLPWSMYFQTPDFLERTRLMLIAPDYEPLIGKWCGLKDGAQVLDVGCGTGYFTRLLKRVCPGAQVTGLEKDSLFVERARKEAGDEDLAIEYIEGDALALPFPDQSFDLVVSHTFLTCVPDPEKAFGQMKRVLRPGGRIASVTTMSYSPSVYQPGEYPEDCPWGAELNELLSEVWQSYEKVVPVRRYSEGLPPGALPGFFVRQGLKQVSAYPIGKLFSLSNAAIPTPKKEKWLDLYLHSEEDKMKAFLSLPEGVKVLPRETAERYLELVREKCKYYREHPEENAIWEFQGGANLLVTGDLDGEVG